MASDVNNIALRTTLFSDYDIPWDLHSTPRYNTLNNTIVLPPLQKKVSVLHNMGWQYDIFKYTIVLKFN